MLDETTRSAILRLRAEGHGSRAIAEALGISRGAVKRVLRDGRAKVPHLRRRHRARERHRAQVMGAMDWETAVNLILDEKSGSSSAESRRVLADLTRKDRLVIFEKMVHGKTKGLLELFDVLPDPPTESATGKVWAARYQALLVARDRYWGLKAFVEALDHLTGKVHGRHLGGASSSGAALKDYLLDRVWSYDVWDRYERLKQFFRYRSNRYRKLRRAYDRSLEAKTKRAKRRAARKSEEVKAEAGRR